MPTSAPGNKQSGFTLIELLVVIALIAIASAMVSLSLRDPEGVQLEREADLAVVGEFDGVADEVDEDLMEAEGVA